MCNKKMSDVFELPMMVDGYSVESQPSTPIGCVGGCVGEFVSDIECDSGKDAEYVAHAINNHDRLTEENKQLREMLKRLTCAGTELLNIEDVEDEEDSATIHSNFNDELIKAEKLLNK